MAAAAARAGGEEPILDNTPTYMGKLRKHNIHSPDKALNRYRQSDTQRQTDILTDRRQIHRQV